MDIFLNDEEDLNDEGYKTIHWKVFKNLNYPPRLQGVIWQIYAENDIKLKSKEYHRIALGLGYTMSKGVICVSIVSNLKHCLTLLNGLCLDQETENIVICLFNFSKESITIKQGVPFAYIKYFK